MSTQQQHPGPTPGRKLGRISVVYDVRLSREKASALQRVLNSVRTFAEVKLLPGNIAEEELLHALEDDTPHLVLIPWYRYLSWSKAEAFFGLTRTSGPTVAGYHFDKVMADDLGVPEHLRTILLDFGGPTANESARIVRVLLQDHHRSGIRPLLEPSSETAIYFETWKDQQGLGHRIDSVLALPEIAKSEWLGRASCIRVTLGALWSLVYEHGAGKSEFAQSLTTTTGAQGQAPSTSARAWFQVGAGANFLALRLCYSMPNWSPKDTLGFFWPDPQKPTSAPQLMLRYADFVRVHRIADTPDIEVVAGFFKTAPSERFHGQVHTLWVEPLSPQLVSEVPYDKNGKNLKPLPMQTPTVQVTDTLQVAARDRMIQDLVRQVKEHQRILKEKEEHIEELRAGGVGTAPALPPPDADSFLEAFQDRFHASQMRIDELEQQISNDPAEIARTQQELSMLHLTQESWVRKLASILKTYAEERKKLRKAG